jgi:hypothetical protein
MRQFFIFLCLSISSIVSGTTYYISPTGQDINPGTIERPIFTLSEVWKVIAPGDTVYLRGGRYYYTSSQFLTGKNGTSSLPINIWAYPGEVPIITKTEAFNYTWSSGICFIGNYFHWKGIEITGFSQTDPKIYVGLRITDANDNIFELINSHHNGHGCVITGKSGNNQVINSDFHHNSDPLTATPYDNADGLEICYVPAGYINTVKGCRFWYNSDDGIDLWLNDGLVIIDSCWSWNNGYISETHTPAGNGVGFKLGKTEQDHGNKILRQISHCISYDNRTWGFHQNGANAAIELHNNTACMNGAQGYCLETLSKQHVLKNNISHKHANLPSFTSQTLLANNTFLNKALNNSYSVEDSDFLSLDGTQLLKPRNKDGSLPDIDFLHLIPGSDLIDAGINVGLPFSGQAPDIGAFETVPPTPVVANQSPVVTISSPSNSASFTSPAAITVNASASDGDGAIIKVEFFQGTIKIGEKITAPYSINWKEVPEGTYSLTAVATDNVNSKTVSAAVSITVVKPATPVNKMPTVSIASPTKGSSFTAPATVTIDVNASDPDGSITKVELFNGAAKLYEKTAAPYSFTLKDLPAGSYELKAVATDNMKASSTSSSLDLTVTSIEARDYFNLYPNPNDGRFSIDFTTLLDADIFTVTIVDLIGKTVYREQLSRAESTRHFDLSHLNSGIYVLMIAANQILLTQKFIKG